MPVRTDVGTVFADLRDALAMLEKSRESPKEVRRYFARFVSLSQQLTAVMRREYKERTGAAWQASRFTGWTPVTELFKALRNVAEHEALLRIRVHERQDRRSASVAGAVISFEGTWELDDPLADEPPSGLRAVRADPETGEPTDEELELVGRQFRFFLYPPDRKLQGLIEGAGTADVHVLARRCFHTLEEYVELYRSSLPAA